MEADRCITTTEGETNEPNLRPISLTLWSTMSNLLVLKVLDFQQYSAVLKLSTNTQALLFGRHPNQENPLWTYFLVTCPRLNISQLAGLRGRRRKTQLSLTIGCWVFIYWCSEDHITQFSSSLSRFLQETSESQDHFARRQLLLVKIFWLAQDINAKYIRYIAWCTWSAAKWISRQV